MIKYNKDEIKENLSVEDNFQLLEEFGAEPQYSSFGIIATTIDHNNPGEGSRKLYYYSNSNLYVSYTAGTTFDVYQLVINVFEIQRKQKITLNQAIHWIAQKFGFNGEIIDFNEEILEDWNYLKNYERVQNLSIENLEEIVILKEYNNKILNNFNYSLKIEPWLKEGISQEIIEFTNISYYLGKDQIVIPHYDINNRLIGIRGRCMSKSESEQYGKYKPLRVCGQLYNHPLGLNLYGLNWSKQNIQRSKTAIIFEGEKACLKYMTWYPDNNISVAVCGSSLSNYQIQLLINLGVENIIIAFDKAGENDDKSNYVKKFYKLNEKYGNYLNLSFLYDKDDKYLSYKESPTDRTKEIFEQLLKERIVL